VAPDYLDVNIEGSFICCHINNDTACSVCDRISHTSQQNRLSLSRLLFSLSHFQRFVIRNGSGLPGYQLSVSCTFKKVVVSCVLPTQGLVSSGGPTATLEIDVSLVLGKWTSANNSLFKWLLKTYSFGR